MLPAGYMLKRTTPPPDWLDAAPHVQEVCSVSSCFVKPFADYTGYWRHNGFWLFDSPAIIRELIDANGIETADTRMFYYEAYEFQLDWNGLEFPEEGWIPYSTEEWGPTKVISPDRKHLLGYDVIAYGDTIECSPLSCNSMASELAANANCLFDTFDEAKRAVDEGRFEGCEPGYYRIFAVYSVDG